MSWVPVSQTDQQEPQEGTMTNANVRAERFACGRWVSTSEHIVVESVAG